jgi:steroid 5-alpha reductase family enzyme
MSLPNLFLANFGTIIFVMVLLWVVSILRRDASIVDLFWGAGFVLIAWLTLLLSRNFSWRALVLLLLVNLWGLRLTGYLTWRNWGKPEDYRYRAMRERQGNLFPLVSLFTVYGLQGLLMWVISWPLQVGIARVTDWNLFATAGVALFCVGFLFESIGDFQLARFKSKKTNRGQVMNQGLWRYTRHPNYFGDFLVWWGFSLIAVQAEWWWTLVSPLIMSFLLIRVSGVRLLESSLRTRVAGYEDYVRSTSGFFPLPPKQVGKT